MKTILLTVLLLGASFANADVNSSLTKLGNVIQNNVPEKNRGPLIEAYNKLVDDLNKLECASDDSTTQQKRSDCEVVKSSYGTFYVKRGNTKMSQYEQSSAITSANDFRELVNAGICKAGSIADDCEVVKSSFGTFYVKRGNIKISQYEQSSAITSADDLKKLRAAGLCN
ncbi:hypothetical protein K2X05_15230 [bacterium]|nr:hypothetical protein [bacterium]